MTADLAAWLAAQLDEIEEVAQKATPGPWSADDEHGDWLGAERAWCISKVTEAGDYSHDIAYLSVDSADPIGRQESADAAHIALHDPVFVLDWVAAQRKIVELHSYGWISRKPGAPEERVCDVCAASGTWDPWPCPTLLALARPFRGRPGWREEWDTGHGG